LQITLPAKAPCEHAFAFKVVGTGLKPSAIARLRPGVQPAADGSVTLLPETAELHGVQVRVEEQHGHAYIAAWDRPEDSVSWALEAPAHATYQIDVVYSAASGGSTFEISVAGQTFAGKAEQTTDWFRYRKTSPGKVEIPRAGVQELAIRAHDPAAWKPVNIRSVTLTRIR
jgi:hypothetical protein